LKDVSMKNRACDMGIPISDDDLKDWPLDMVDLYYDRWKKRIAQFLSPKHNAARKAYKAERKKIVDAEWERRRAEVDLFLVSKEVMTDNIRDVWSDDMMEYYMDINMTKDEQMKEMDILMILEVGYPRMKWKNCWNIRGLSQTSKEDEVKLFIREECLSMCAIVETRLRKKSDNTVCERLIAGWAWTSNAVESRKGCIIIVGAAILLTSVVVVRLLVLQFMGLMGFLGLLCTQDMFQVQLAMVLFLSACFLVQECNKVYIIDKGFRFFGLINGFRLYG
ncbi:RNA-directed DNA polymerase, eukaryota, reverse transcriptase zinc-binding domain protein, partial [Tanacetum coccineum]